MCPAGAAGRHATEMAGVVSSIASTAGDRLSQQPPTLPPKKQVDVPPEGHVRSLCCPPDSVVMDLYRQEKQKVLQVRTGLRHVLH